MWDGPASGAGMSSQVMSPRGVVWGRVPSGSSSGSGPPPGGMWDRQNPGSGPLRDGMWHAPVKMEEDATGPPRDGIWDGPSSGVEMSTQVTSPRGVGGAGGGGFGLPARYLGADEASGLEARMGPPRDGMWDRQNPGAGGVGLPPRYLGEDEAQVLPSTRKVDVGLPVQY